MKLWSIINDYRGYLRENSDAEVDAALDNWLIPELENILSVTSFPEEVYSIPTYFKLHQNYPNPFNPATTIRYSVNKPTYVDIKTYDILGRVVSILVNEDKNPGNYNIRLNGSGYIQAVFIFAGCKQGIFQKQRN